MNLGEYIKSKREEAGLTQEQLANVINKKKDFISSIETGKVKSIKDKNIAPIAKALGCPVSIFFHGFDKDGKLINPKLSINPNQIEYLDDTDFEEDEALNKIMEEKGFVRLTADAFFDEVKELLDKTDGIKEEDRNYILHSLGYICDKNDK